MSDISYYWICTENTNDKMRVSINTQKKRLDVCYDRILSQGKGKVNTKNKSVND